MDWPVSKAGRPGPGLACTALHSFGTAIGRRSLDERLTPSSLHVRKWNSPTVGRDRGGTLSLNARSPVAPGPLGGRLTTGWSISSVISLATRGSLRRRWNRVVNRLLA